MKTFIAALFMTVSAGAFADQCQLISAEQADRAALLIQSGSEIAYLCQNCGETIPNAEYTTARKVELRDSYGYKEMTIKGQGVDLAYTYVKVAPRKYVNVASVIGCEAEGMSKIIVR